ncbi:MAG: hypothetical protein KGD57_00230, partial [Candidatus Lokiarchaeota archaeon]|nr:hypothetical protein [Candidatus Lokiarchaeota archaeon]
ESISVFYGQKIVINSFNITDAENTINYITISLVNQYDEWYNITRLYTAGLEVIIRTIDLLSGVWTVYMQVTDIDGATTSLTNDYGLGPQQITIIPDTLGPAIPYLTLIFGAIFGILIGIGIGFRTLKYRAESRLQQTKQKQVSSKKKSTEVKKLSKQKIQKSEESTETKEEKEVKPVKKKIKRRL